MTWLVGLYQIIWIKCFVSLLATNFSPQCLCRDISQPSLDCHQSWSPSEMVGNSWINSAGPRALGVEKCQEQEVDEGELSFVEIKSGIHQCWQ